MMVLRTVRHPSPMRPARASCDFRSLVGRRQGASASAIKPRGRAAGMGPGRRGEERNAGTLSSGMFDEPNESPAEDAANPADRAREKADEFRTHAELAAVFEGPRKFDAELRPGLDPDLAREVQRTMGRLAKAKSPESPVLPETSAADAAELL